jgi:hypothetical protein
MMTHSRWVLLAALSIYSRRGVGKTRTQIRNQVKLERHREVSQGFIYVSRSESESEYKCETVNEAKYSTGLRKHNRGETYKSYGSLM